MMAIDAPSKFLLRAPHETNAARNEHRSKSAALEKCSARKKAAHETSTALKKITGRGQ